MARNRRRGVMGMLLEACGATNGWDALIVVTFMVIIFGGLGALIFWTMTHD
jgi:hypothetical protein